MIESTRAVRGQDLEDLREKLCLTVDDMGWLLGISMPRWSHMVQDENIMKPIRDTTIAMLARLLDARPDLCFIPKMPTPQEILEAIKQVEPDITMKEVSIMLGREASSCFHWIQRDRRAAPPVLRLGYIINEVINNDRRNGKKMINDLRSSVAVESKARNVQDIWKTGSWVSKADRPKTNRGRKKATAEE